MTELLVLSEADVEAALDLGELHDALVDCFRSISAGRIHVPPRTAVDAPAGSLLTMPGRVGDTSLAVKLVTLFAANADIGLPSHQGAVMLFDIATGTPTALMGAEFLTQMRTAVASAIAADLLADPDAEVLALIGAGVQGRGHLRTFRRLRPWREIRVWNRTAERAARLVEGEPAAIVSDSVAEAVRGAHVVALCTHGSEPLFAGDSVAPGAHVSSVGIGREIPDDLLSSARVVVEWTGAAAEPPPAGALDLVAIEPDEVVELGALLDGLAPGREHRDQITIYKSTGHAAEDAVAAAVAHRRARALGIGATVEV